MACNPIMIVEDEADLRETLKDLLEIEGFRVVTAENGKEGLGLLQQMGEPCLILLDLMMPVMNGWEFLQALKSEANSGYASIPVTVVSAAADVTDVEVQYGCKVLPKPLSIERLMSLAHQHCEAS